MKYTLLIPAIILDFVQFMLGMIFIALQFMTPVGGAVAGGLTGALYCWNTSTGIISGVLSAAQCGLYGTVLGTALTTFATPLGAAIDVALSITVGGGILLLLGFNGMFYPQIVVQRALGEIMPFFSFLPIWTNLVWACLREKQKETQKPGTVATAVNFIAAPKQGLKDAAQNMVQKRFSPQFNDIRPAAKTAALALLLMFGVHTHAQTVPAPIQYVVASETPGAHETVIIKAEGVGSFLGSANFTWSQDGKITKTGIGERTYSFTTGNLGERTAVRVTIDSSQGIFTKTFNFNPSRINLIWEAYTSVPPLYRGKPLYSAGSDYKIVALPTVYAGAARVSASALSYQWFYKGSLVPEVSGLGKNTFTKTGDQLQTGESVAVEVYYGVTKVGRAELFIPASDPTIVFYQRDPLRGVLYDAAIPAGISLSGREITVKAEPFFFSTASLKSGLIPFVWTLNDSEVAGPDSAQGILTLRQSGSGRGSANVGVSMQNANTDQLVQEAETSLQIVFGADQATTLFNFIGL